MAAIGAAALLGWVVMAGPLAPARSVAAQSSPDQSSPDQVTGVSGQVLYASSCAACHGPQGGGSADGPALTNVGAASADFMLRTGRMPLSAPGAPVIRGRPAFDDAQIRALVAYVASFGAGPSIPNVQVTGAGDLPAGRALYTANCAACHGAGAGGDAVGGGSVAPPLLATDPTQVGEAIRTGPGVMPVFNANRVSDADLDAIAAYLAYLRQDAAPGGQTVGGVGPVAEGYVAWLVYLVGLLVVARWIERRRRA